MIADSDWNELALTFRQLEVWYRSAHRVDAEQPWWELEAAGTARVLNAVETARDGHQLVSYSLVDLARREDPGGCDTPLNIEDALATAEPHVKRDVVCPEEEMGAMSLARFCKLQSCACVHCDRSHPAKCIHDRTAGLAGLGAYEGMAQLDPWGWAVWGDESWEADLQYGLCKECITGEGWPENKSHLWSAFNEHWSLVIRRDDMPYAEQVEQLAARDRVIKTLMRHDPKKYCEHAFLDREEWMDMSQIIAHEIVSRKRKTTGEDV